MPGVIIKSRTICILSIIVDSFAEACMKKFESVGISDEFKAAGVT